MSKNANKQVEKAGEFWDVFIEDIPRVPSVDELICRIVGINYPRGIVTDINGAEIQPPRDPRRVTKKILGTIKRAVDLEENFWVRHLRENHLFTPYSWAVRLSGNIAITEAEKLINEALDHVGNIQALDTLFWVAYRRTEVLCAEDNAQINWPPFKRK